MGKLIEFFVALAWSVCNLFLGYHIVCAIGARWDIAFLQEVNLPFRVYWGSLFALGIAMCPLFSQIAMISTDKKKQDGQTIACILTTVGMLFTWFMSTILNVIFY